MDQLRTFLAEAKRHAFWVMCGIILLVSLGSWWYSTGKLAEAKAAQESKITSVMKSVENVQRNNPLHPNQASIEGMDQLIKLSVEEVYRGWDAQYSRQKDVLVWPSDFGDDFLNAVEPLRPIEQLSYPTPISKEIDVSYRRRYRNFIPEELPKIAEIIGTIWTASAAASNPNSGSGYGDYQPSYSSSSSSEYQQMGPDGRPLVVNDPNIVAWPQARQQELFDTHFGFAAQTDAPATLQVLYAQEDIWVLTSLMSIIAATNEAAEARHDAAIKEIDFIRMGRNALGFSGQVTVIGTPKALPGSTSTEGSTSTSTSTSSESGRVVGPPSSGQSMYGGGTAVMVDPAEGRYVDSNFMPIPAEKLRAALTSTNPEDIMLGVAKRMPVRMRFNMDQRKLNRLLAECGNAKLPLEVRQVRINRPAGTGQSGGYGSSSGYGGSSDYGSSQQVMPSYGSDYGGPPGASGARGLISDATIDQNVIPVEIYGVVYIYNPANKKQLGITEEPTTTAGTDSPAASTVPVTPTAAPAAN
jgi:hypothetical protein